jgi:hypothetical protein
LQKEPSQSVTYSESEADKNSVSYLNFDNIRGVLEYSPRLRLESGATLSEAVDAHIAITNRIGPHRKFSILVDGNEVSLLHIDPREIEAVVNATVSHHCNCTAIKIKNPNLFTKIGYCVIAAVDPRGLAKKVQLE